MESEEIDHEYTDNIICPYCGAEDGDSWECMPDEEDLGHIECCECEKKFLAQRLITIKYSTSKIDWLKEWKTWNKNAIFHSDAVRQLRKDGYYKP